MSPGRFAYCVVACALTVPFWAGCASFRPAPVESAPFLERALSAERGDVQVTVAVPTVEEARLLFDSKLHKKRIQPIWIEVRNEGDETVWFLPYSVDRDSFPPLEAAWKSHRRWARKVNRRIDEFFYDSAMPWFVAPGDSAAGFVFVNLNPGVRYVPIQLIRKSELVELEFVVKVPGFRADHAAVDFQGMYETSEVRGLLSEDDLRSWIERQPCCTENKKATRTGDPLNFVLVGEDSAFTSAFLRAGWDETEALTAGTSMKTATAAVFGKTYRNAPVSPLYVFGRPQDLALQKGRWNIHQRNHLRLWLAPVTYQGVPVGVGQISRDIGSRLTRKSSTFTTHKIDPDVDDARDFLLFDLATSERLAAFAYADGVGQSTPDAPRGNLTGDPFFTDGMRLLLVLTDEPTDFEQIRFLEWEPPAPDDEP